MMPMSKWKLFTGLDCPVVHVTFELFYVKGYTGLLAQLLPSFTKNGSIYIFSKYRKNIHNEND